MLLLLVTVAAFLPPLPHRVVPRYGTRVMMAKEENKLPWFVDPGTYGGVIVLTVVGCVAPFVVYSALLSFGLDANTTGVVLSGILVIGSIILWTLSYVFRVYNKNMTYSVQLKNYEDAVIQKRFEELDDDEVAALMDEIERDDTKF